ncbi:unnamed protein product [marine sediment metagenome]|uniref:Uncharacterized protein n=1 Tax=marine sediment metagenome TaxID=412755 RepID=X1VWX1_9ZZZZ
MEIPEAIEELTSLEKVGLNRLTPKEKKAVRIGKNALVLFSHRTTYCLDDHSLMLLRDAQRREHEK